MRYIGWKAAAGCLGAILLASCDGIHIMDRSVDQENIRSGVNDSAKQDDRISVSAANSDLNWEMFEIYPYEDIGSGLYIRIYDIGSGNFLRITGSSLKSAPMGVVWIRSDGTEVNVRDQAEWNQIGMRALTGLS